jgi:multiple sugar transport system substrate-binding protein
MKRQAPSLVQQPARRRALKQAASVGVLAAATPQLLFAQADDLAAYRSAKINWKQAEGESISGANRSRWR